MSQFCGKSSFSLLYDHKLARKVLGHKIKSQPGNQKLTGYKISGCPARNSKKASQNVPGIPFRIQPENSRLSRKFVSWPENFWFARKSKSSQKIKSQLIYMHDNH